MGFLLMKWKQVADVVGAITIFNPKLSVSRACPSRPLPVSLFTTLQRHLYARRARITSSRYAFLTEYS